MGFRPWVNYALIAVNVAIFLLITLPLSSTGVQAGDPRVDEYLRLIIPSLPPGVSPRQILAQLSEYDLFVFEHGFKPAAPQFTDLFFSMFLHGGFMHLAGNMLFLWIYGDNVEHRIGRATYLGVYLGTGLVATLTFAMFASTSSTPLVGASGAISGVLGLYFLCFPRNEVKLIIPLFFYAFWVRARWVLGFYVVVDNIVPFVSGASSNVAYGAHLGGFFAGLAVAWAIESNGPGASRSSSQPPDEVQSVETYLARGQLAEGLSLAETLGAGQLAMLAPKSLYVISRSLAESGRDTLAARALRRALPRFERSPNDQAVIHLALGELRLAQLQPVSAYQHLLTVIDLAPDSESATRARAALEALSQRGEMTHHW